MTVGYSALPIIRQRITCTRGRLTSVLTSVQPRQVWCAIVHLWLSTGTGSGYTFFESFVWFFCHGASTAVPSSPVSLILTGVCRLSISLVSISRKKGPWPNYVCLKLKLIYTQYQSRRPLLEREPRSRTKQLCGYSRTPCLASCRAPHQSPSVTVSPKTHFRPPDTADYQLLSVQSKKSRHVRGLRGTCDRLHFDVLEWHKTVVIIFNQRHTQT